MLLKIERKYAEEFIRKNSQKWKILQQFMKAASKNFKQTSI